MDIVDDAWRKDKLPEEDIAVPLSELPDPESDNGESYVQFISYSNALSFYRSQNALGWSKFFVPDQKFIYVLWQS